MRLSIIIPTRERADYLAAAIRSCLESGVQDLEVMVLDNASQDNTRDVVQQFSDPRVRYEVSGQRLSMRDNFERGLDLARGEVISFIGDDDGMFSFSAETALDLFDRHAVGAVSSVRAHYAWPDLLAARRGTGLVPRGAGVRIKNSRDSLKSVLTDDNYYALPCLYHGFVARHLVEKIKARDGRFFHSSQVDMYSSIALSMENVSYAFVQSPLIINGGSSRSNGAAHFGGGASVEKENWKKEDELGFLPGFEGYSTVGILIVESAIRYANLQGREISIGDILEPSQITEAFVKEVAARTREGKPVANLLAAADGVGFQPTAPARTSLAGSKLKRLLRLARTFTSMSPIDLQHHGVTDVYEAARFMERRLADGGTRLLSHPLEEVRTAMRIAS